MIKVRFTACRAPWISLDFTSYFTVPLDSFFPFPSLLPERQRGEADAACIVSGLPFFEVKGTAQPLNLI